MSLFEKKSRLDMKLESLDSDIALLQNRYWELWHKHTLLLQHLGLSEHKVPERIELRTKGGPERGD